MGNDETGSLERTFFFSSYELKEDHIYFISDPRLPDVGNNYIILLLKVPILKANMSVIF